MGGQGIFLTGNIEGRIADSVRLPGIKSRRASSCAAIAPSPAQALNLVTGAQSLFSNLGRSLRRATTLPGLKKSSFAYNFNKEM